MEPFTPPREEWKLVTPAIATQMLAAEEETPRNLSRARVLRYGRDMLGGSWTPASAESIHFDADGRRQNGTHRFKAILWAKKQDENFEGVWARFTYGLNQAEVANIDTGISRTPAHRLQMQGEPNSALLASVLVRARAWDAGFKTPVNYKAAGGDYVLGEQEYLEAHRDELHEAVRLASRLQAGKNEPKTATGQVIGFAYYLFSRLDPELALEYLTSVTRGTGSLVYGDPALTVRNELLKLRSDPKRSASADIMLAIMIDGWNKLRQGKKTKLVRLPYNPKTERYELTTSNFPDAL